ncbi:hypothetical protein R3P38DRAFT_3570813 [Favolaschia claudopus]|uniref:Uncharacterized protein n=1 Tax=Favolaschia claudopus TaxID=2862362 RepID=A0AAW0AQT6_9AGAR
MACVDPHLVSAVDIIIDVDDAALGMSEKAQRSCLRRLLVYMDLTIDAQTQNLRLRIPSDQTMSSSAQNGGASPQSAPRNRLYPMFAVRQSTHTPGSANTAQAPINSTADALFNPPQPPLQPGLISDAALAALFADLNIVSPPEVDNVVDESGGDEVSDDVDETPEPESHPEAERGGICEGFLQTIVTNLQAEIKNNKSGRPSVYDQGTFWYRARDPVFALEATRLSEGGMNPRELYMLDTFLWLPGLKTKLPGEPHVLTCPQPHCLGRLTRKGYNSKPTARRVQGQHRDYFLLSPIASNATNHRESFPAFITARAAIDKPLLAFMRACYNSRCGPKPFSEALSEMHHLDHAQRDRPTIVSLTPSVVDDSVNGPVRLHKSPQLP